MRRSAHVSRRQGGTLIELLISLSLLGIMASVVTLAIRRITPPDPTDPMTIIADTMSSIMAAGRPATLRFQINGRPALATLNPDGSIVADSLLGIERFTGRRLRAR
jgi:prepilin-type N-terminal cleavage/methylation domain-containing protein